MAEIGKRIRFRREALGITQEELASKLGYKNKSTIAKIENGTNDIVQSKVIEFAKVLGTTVAYLMGWDSEEDSDISTPCYLNDETARAAQEIFENKELRLLFDAARDAQPEDLTTVRSMSLALKRKERGGNDDTGC